MMWRGLPARRPGVRAAPLRAAAGMVLTDGSQHIQPMQQALTQMHRTRQHDEAVIATPLHGQWREAHQCARAPAGALDAISHQHIATCDRGSIASAPRRSCGDICHRRKVAPGNGNQTTCP
jgi:hypothetical protein